MSPTGSTVTDPTTLMDVSSDLLGPISVPAQETFTFSEGLLGFPDARSFVLVPAERDGFFWLQSVEFSALTFLLADPFPLVEGFYVELTDAEVGVLEPEDGSEIAVLAILTLPRSDDDAPTVNLQGPLVLNMRRGLGRQLVVQESKWGVRWSLDLGAGSAD